MGSTKYYKMLDAYLDFYTDYVNTSTDLMCASVMLDANDLPVLILVSEPDDDGVSTFSFYGFEKNKVIFISKCDSYLTYSDVYTDGIVELRNDSYIWYQIKDNQMYKIEDGNGYYMDGEKIAEEHQNDDFEAIYSYYIDGKRIDATADDIMHSYKGIDTTANDTYDLYSQEIENLCIEYYTSIYGDDVINSYLEWRSVDYFCSFIDLDFLSAELFWFSDLYESGYGNNYVDFQMLISELKEMTDVNQKEFYFTTVNYLVANGYSDSYIYEWAAGVILNRDTSWMPDLLEAWGKWEDYDNFYGYLYVNLLEDEHIPLPNNVSYTSEQVFGKGNDSATYDEMSASLYYIVAYVTEAKIAELEAQYGISEDVIYGIIDWWHSDEYISAIDTALETRLEYLDAVSADSSLIGYWECGDEMLKIYYSEDEGGLVIDADVAEKTGIPSGNYYCYGYDYGGNYGDYYDYYEFEEYFLGIWCIEKGVEYVSMEFECEGISQGADGYFDMILTCVDDNTLEIKFIPEGEYYDTETGEAVDVSVTSTFTRHTLTEEEIAVINAKEAYADYIRDEIDNSLFAILDIDGDDIPEILYGREDYEYSLLYYYNGEVCQYTLMCSYPYFYYHPSENNMECDYGHGGDYGFQIFHIENGSVVIDTKTGYYTEYSEEYEEEIYIYYLNENEISEDEYNNILDSIDFDYYSEGVVPEMSYDEIMDYLE